MNNVPKLPAWVKGIMREVDTPEMQAHPFAKLLAEMKAWDEKHPVEAAERQAKIRRAYWEWRRSLTPRRKSKGT